MIMINFYHLINLLIDYLNRVGYFSAATLRYFFEKVPATTFRQSNYYFADYFAAAAYEVDFATSLYYFATYFHFLLLGRLVANYPQFIFKAHSKNSLGQVLTSLSSNNVP